MLFKVVTWAFSWVSPMPTESICVIKLQFFFSKSFFLLYGDLSQEPKKAEGKLFFLPYKSMSALTFQVEEGFNR